MHYTGMLKNSRSCLVSHGICQFKGLNNLFLVDFARGHTKSVFSTRNKDMTSNSLAHTMNRVFFVFSEL